MISIVRITPPIGLLQSLARHSWWPVLTICFLLSPLSQAATDFSCAEISPNRQWNCVLAETGTTQLQMVQWTAFSPLVFDYSTDDGTVFEAEFECAQTSGNGSVRVNYTATTGEQGTATFTTDCDGAPTGGATCDPQFNCGFPPPPPPCFPKDGDTCIDPQFGKDEQG